MIGVIERLPGAGGYLKTVAKPPEVLLRSEYPPIPVMRSVGLWALFVHHENYCPFERLSTRVGLVEDLFPAALADVDELAGNILDTFRDTDVVAGLAAGFDGGHHALDEGFWGEKPGVVRGVLRDDFGAHLLADGERIESFAHDAFNL